MKEYYCLLLNNCYDTDIHYVSFGEKCTMLPKILDKSITDLSTLEEEFMELDYMIENNPHEYHIYGKFPVIGELIDGKMYDVITGKYIQESPNGYSVEGLSYKYKIKAYQQMVKLLLELLDNESIKRYTERLNQLNSYSILLSAKKNISTIKYLTIINGQNKETIIRSINGCLYEPFTKNIVYCINDNMVTSELSCKYLKKTGKEQIVDYEIYTITNGVSIHNMGIYKSKTNANYNYHRFIETHQNKPKTKIRTK